MTLAYRREVVKWWPMNARSIADYAGLAALALLASSAVACDRSDTKDAGAGGSASAASSASSALAMVTPACKAGYVDGTNAASHTLAWSPAIASDPKRCLKVKAGTTVTWTTQTGFSVYPIVPGAMGPTSSPITATASGESVEAKFDVPGFFPYACSKRPDMTGTIWVVPQN